MKNIVLFCAAGMSTSMLVNKMRASAEAEGYECEINAYSLTQVAAEGPAADMVLLGPQVAYNLAKVKAQLPGKPVETIDMMAYGMMDGKKVLDQVKKALGD